MEVAGTAAVPAPGAQRLGVNVSCRGELVTTWSCGGELVIGRHTGSRTDWATTPLRLELSHYPVADVWPGGGFLVLGSRSERSGPERDAVRLDENMRVVERGVLGYGIAHLIVDRGGSIWCGYLDEGVFGNSDDVPVGAFGLNRFDGVTSPPSWTLDTVPDGFELIDDCYALNVDRDVWACYYSTFPIVRIRDGATWFWHNRSGTAPQALIVDEPAVALVGGYGSDRDLVVIGELGVDEFVERERVVLRTPTGERLADTTHLFGRGPVLHAITDDTTWTTIRIEALRDRGV